MFDKVVMINHRSTDQSCEIIQELAPHWEIVDTVTKDFNAQLCDDEVMFHEARFEANFKIVLNITEFLICPNIEYLEKMLDRKEQRQIIFSGAIMIDADINTMPDCDKPLIREKKYGIWESDIWFGFISPKLLLHGPYRSRVAHCNATGDYYMGRHVSRLPEKIKIDRSVAAIWWYGFSPLNINTLKRKLQIQGQIPKEDILKNNGIHHFISKGKIHDQYNYLIKKAVPLHLSSMTKLQRCMARIRNIQPRKATELWRYRLICIKLKKWILKR